VDQILAWQVIIIIITWFTVKWIMRALFVALLLQMVARLIDQIKNSLKGGGQEK
jgi:hypothetical protein